MATPNLAIPETSDAVLGRDVTHNMAVRVLDAHIQPTVEEKDLSAAPASPDDGVRYLVANGTASGDPWGAMDLKMAYFQNTAWVACVRRTGDYVYIKNESQFRTWDGSAWQVGPT